MMKSLTGITSILAAGIISAGLFTVPVHAEEPASGTYSVQVEISGIVVAYFTSITSWGSQNEILEQVQPDGRIIKVPGKLVHPNITFSRGISWETGTELWDWRKNVTDNILDKRSTSIILKDGGTEIKRWNAYECWPVEMKVDGMNAQGDLLIESMTMAFEHIELSN